MATATHLESSAHSSRVEDRRRRGELSAQQVDAFDEFLHDVDRELLQHPIVRHNSYTEWFQHGTPTDDELRRFVQQFSVFSNQFLIASLLRVINAPTLKQARSGKEILLNELGVVYRPPNPQADPRRRASEEQQEREGDPDLVSTEGTVDGGIFRFRAAHFEWLLAVGAGLGLTFDDMGKRAHGWSSTLRFCDELQRLYGHEDPWIAEGASFAVENWAAAGFWQDLEDGLTAIKGKRLPKLPIAFFTWHNRVEAQHAGHTMDELEDVYFSAGFDRARFLEGGRQVLDAIAVFWEGVEDDRRLGSNASN